MGKTVAKVGGDRVTCEGGGRPPGDGGSPPQSAGGDHSGGRPLPGGAADR